MLDYRREDVYKRQCHPLPKYPAIHRDIALMADIAVPVATIEEVIRKAAGDSLVKIGLFDVYQGSQLPNGKRSLAYNSVSYTHLDVYKRQVFISPPFSRKEGRMLFLKLKHNMKFSRTDKNYYCVIYYPALLQNI